jgi:hypothetical protein
MARWPTTLRIGQDLKLLVTGSEGDDLLKARLPRCPPHPRALLTLLEGVALFAGEPVCAVISVRPEFDHWLGSELWGEQLWPTESPLVQFDFAVRPANPVRRLHGVGDFRALRGQPRPGRHK